MKRKNELLNIGLLILRVGIGITMFLHGLPKIMGGSEVWGMVGSTMSNFGIDSGHEFWGLLAALAESVGGIFFALGLLFRPTAFVLTGTMVVALITHLAMGDDFMAYGHALDLLIIFAASIFLGAGKYSLDAKLFPRLL